MLAIVAVEAVEGWLDVVNLALAFLDGIYQATCQRIRAPMTGVNYPSC
ncbi:hypothetical protein M8C21_020208 [Ambrosia artemisiifolia]|uniref:Uncharacterized protein n=1 Tax=Ambrosia artemisiifolia TaxID=4212 RepID=A0AAD5BNV7_AMBAR|nr:hypothetical protein M8C21_020208 [Ambrosia artemisiifolia]